MAIQAIDTNSINDVNDDVEVGGLSGKVTSYTAALTLISFALYSMIEKYSSEQMTLATSVQQEQKDKADQMLKDMGAYDAPNSWEGKNEMWAYCIAHGLNWGDLCRDVLLGSSRCPPELAKYGNQDPVGKINLIMDCGFTDQSSISNLVAQQTTRLNNMNTQLNQVNTVYSSLSQQVTDDISRTSQTLSTLLDMVGNKGIVALMQVITQMLGR